MEGFDLKEQQIIDLRKTELIDYHKQYLESHPELTQLLNDFTTEVLYHKPDDLILFAKEYFAKFNPNPIKNKPLAIVGPSGVGKSTFINRLRELFPGVFEFSVSSTTRKPREGEEHGREYFFLSIEEFEQKKDQGEFLEWACVHGNYYGTSKHTVEDVYARGKVCLLDIDVQGVKQIWESGLDFNRVFIMPKTMKQLEDRLKARNTDEESVLRVRLRNAQKEIEDAQSDSKLFQYFIVNDDLETAIQEFLDVIYRFYEHLRDK